ncbi:unnamed protein product, partial [Mycena citricolor]
TPIDWSSEIRIKRAEGTDLKKQNICIQESVPSSRSDWPMQLPVNEPPVSTPSRQVPPMTIRGGEETG